MATYPKDARAHRYSVYIDTDTEDLTAEDPDYKKHPLIEDLAAMVARTIENHRA